MGRKDAGRDKGPPVEQYRKNIGKQQWKTNKKEVKEQKRQSEAKKSAMTVQDILLVVGAFFMVLCAIYGLFYYMIQPAKSDTDNWM